MRRPRNEFDAGIHHVYARGNWRQDIFRDDLDRVRYLALLERVVKARRWSCLAFCLMTNHMHLLVETPEPNLGAGMHGSMGATCRTSTRATRRLAVCSRTGMAHD